MLRNVTITVEEEILRWAKRKAADEDTSVSKLVARMFEREMKRPDIRTPEYMAAFERWKKIKPVPGIDASKRLKREELYTRGSAHLRRQQRPAV